MTEIAWVVFFTTIFPALFTGTWLAHLLWMGFIFLFPSLLTSTNDYLMTWFIFESINLAYMLFVSFKRSSK